MVKNGTCLRTMENGIIFRIQRYICKNCKYSFVARPPNYGYGKHYPEDVKDKRVKTSLRKASSMFHIIGNVIISHEVIRRYVPPALPGIMESSGYFVYDEQYSHISGVENYRDLMKDSKNGNFVEEILDDLKEDTLTGFFIRALSRFSIPEEIFITTDGYHYESILEEVSVRLNAKIRRQRCLLHTRCSCKEDDQVHVLPERNKPEETRKEHGCS